MALVKIEEYQGSLISEVVIDALIISGIADILNKQGYIVRMDGLSAVNENGLIEDEPDNHLIRISKELVLGHKRLCNFVKKNKVNKDSDSYNESLKELQSFDLEIPFILGTKRKDISEINLEKDVCIYKHEIQIEKRKREDESIDEYTQRIFNDAVDLLLTSKFKGGN